MQEEGISQDKGLVTLNRTRCVIALSMVAFLAGCLVDDHDTPGKVDEGDSAWAPWNEGGALDASRPSAPDPVARFSGDAAREHFKCMNLAAQLAYKSASDQTLHDGGSRYCFLIYMPDHSTDDMKAFLLDLPHSRSLVLAFSGTRIASLRVLDDLTVDLSSQLPATFKSKLTSGVNYGIYAGAGWLWRWGNQAGKAKSAIDGFLANGNPGPVFVLGHSMGAAVATVAGYDIKKHLSSRGKTNKVYVVAFNSPRPGPASFRDSFQAMMSAGQIYYHLFTRNNDPIHDVPLFVHHPFWNTQLLARTFSEGVLKGTQMGYCPQFHLAESRSKLAAHNNDAWQTDIENIPLEHINCMGNVPFVFELWPR